MLIGFNETHLQIRGLVNTGLEIPRGYCYRKGEKENDKKGFVEFDRVCMHFAS